MGSYSADWKRATIFVTENGNGNEQWNVYNMCERKELEITRWVHA